MRINVSFSKPIPAIIPNKATAGKSLKSLTLYLFEICVKTTMEAEQGVSGDYAPRSLKCFVIPQAVLQLLFQLLGRVSLLITCSLPLINGVPIDNVFYNNRRYYIKGL